MKADIIYKYFTKLTDDQKAKFDQLEELYKDWNQKINVVSRKDIDEFKNRRKLILELLNDIPGFECNEPDGAFYVFPNISSYFGKELNGTKINNASDFAMYILEHANVATVTGDAFGNPNGIRISYAASVDEIKEAVARIKAVL